jgi:hypothetical protein
MSQWLITGSTAMYHWFPDARVPKDIDILTPATLKTSDSTICFVDSSWHEMGQFLIDWNEDPVFMDPESLLALKVSHAHWNIKWQKTMYDIDFLLQKGVTFNVMRYIHLFKVWESIHGKKQVNLAQTKEAFFTDAVPRKHDHDWLHEQVAFNAVPMYAKILTGGPTVMCSESKFNALPFEQQIETMLEELIVTAIERNPKLNSLSKPSEVLKAMSYAYMKCCTSITTGWFALFLILHHRVLFIERKQKWMSKIYHVLEKIS